MTTFKEMIRKVKSEIREVSVEEARAARRAGVLRGRARGRRVGAGARRRAPSSSRAASSSCGSRRRSPTSTARWSSTARAARAARSARARCRTSGYTNVGSMTRRLRTLEGVGPAVRGPEDPHRRAEASATAATCRCPRSARRASTKLLESKVLLVGAGGLGSPRRPLPGRRGRGHASASWTSTWWTCSNLQRQVLHTDGVGRASPRRESAERRIRRRSTRTCKVVRHDVRLEAANVHGRDRALRRDHRRLRQLLDQVPGQRRGRAARARPTSTAASSASTARCRSSCPARVPATAASIPEPTPAEMAPSCDEAGVLGVLPGRGRPHPGHRGDQGAARAGRAADGPPAHLRRARHDVPQVQGAARPEVRGVRRARRRSASSSDLEWSCHFGPPRRSPPRRDDARASPRPPGRSAPSRGHRPHAARPPAPARRAGRGRALRQVRVVQPGRLGQGPHGALARPRGRAQRARCVRAGPSSTRRPGNTAVGLALVGRAQGLRGRAGHAGEREPRSARRSARAYGAAITLHRRVLRLGRRARWPCASGGGGARALLLRRPVPEPREPARPLPHHRPRDLGADRRSPHALRGRPRHHRHHRGHRPLPARARRRGSA